MVAQAINLNRRGASLPFLLNLRTLSFGVSQIVIGIQGKIIGTHISKISSLICKMFELMVKTHLKSKRISVDATTTKRKVGTMCLNLVA